MHLALFRLAFSASFQVAVTAIVSLLESELLESPVPRDSSHEKARLRVFALEVVGHFVADGRANAPADILMEVIELLALPKRTAGRQLAIPNRSPFLHRLLSHSMSATMLHAS